MSEKSKAPIFHSQDGYWLSREPGGWVTLSQGSDVEHLEFLTSFSPAVWSSIVAFVSAREYREAFNLHQGWVHPYA